jgi:hypothetical protein
MDLRILDLVSTKLLVNKLREEMDLERLVNTTSTDLSYEELSNKIIEKISAVRNSGSDFQTWETIVNQLTKSREGDNNKQ